MPTLEIALTHRRAMVRRLRTAGRREIGGIVMAEELAPGRFRLAEFTTDDRAGTRSTFRRSEEQHKAALDSFFSRHRYAFDRYNYLGEWHSHPSFPVIPSNRDRQTMSELISAPDSPDFAVLLIARLDFWIWLRLSATVFQKGYPAYPMEIEIPNARLGEQN